jgi:hypothetical protein
MIKKLLLLPTLIFSFLIFVDCSKDQTDFDLLNSPGTKARPVPGVEVSNNLSFPAIAVDGYTITPLSVSSFTVPYTGTYPGLTDEEIALAQANGPWYPQKTTGNLWQADYVNSINEDVTYVDWGDNIESVNPKIRTPFRLEVTLYKALTTTMTAYTMGLLEYPSSSKELQGTNNTTYENNYATIVSSQPKLVIQYLGSSVPYLTWDATIYRWTLEDESVPTNIPVSFAPELNVGGKYIFGASSGGWKPTVVGYYRVTFYIPSSSGISLKYAIVANASNDFSGPTEGTASFPAVDSTNNLTYVDLLVRAGGSRKP